MQEKQEGQKSKNNETKQPGVYFRVVFAEASDEGAIKDIPLSLNGETLVVQRGKEVILPRDYLEIAEHAKIMSKKYDPLTGAMLPKVIQKFPYSVLGTATEEEFLKMKREGTEKTIAEMKKRERSGENAEL